MAPLPTTPLRNNNGGLTAIKSLSLQILSGRLFMMFGTVIIMAAAGGTLVYGLYTPVLKSALGYDQTTLNLIGFFKDLGANLGIFSGLINEITPPWVVLTMGAALNFFGYFMMWLSVTKKITKPAVWQMCLYMYVAANAQSFANTGALITCVKNFPENRGFVIGLLKSYAALSGAIITQIFHAIYGDNTKNLLLLIAWIPAASCFGFLRTIRMMKVVPSPNKNKFIYNVLYISLGLAAFIMCMIIAQKKVHFNHGGYTVSAIVILLLLFLPLAFIGKEEYNIWKIIIPNGTSSSMEIKIESTSSQTILTANKQESTPWNKNVFNPPKRGEDFTILQAAFSIDMFILCLATFCGVGGTITMIDNIGQLGISFGYPIDSLSTFISLSSIWQYLGRLFSGLISEVFLTKYQIPRPLSLTITLTLECFGLLLIAFNVPNGLYFATVILGFCFGAIWTLLFSIISELFGLKFYSTLYNVGTLSSPIASYVLNVLVTGRLYDQEAEKQLKALGLTRKGGEELNCIGTQCFKLAFIICAVVSAFGALVSYVLVMRSRQFYKSDIYKKFHQESEAADETEEAFNESK